MGASQIVGTTGGRIWALKSMKMAGVGFLVAASTSSLLPAAETAQSGSGAVQQALAARDYRRASIEVNNLITQRLPSNDKGGPDEILDPLVAELISITGNPASAVSILRRVIENRKVLNPSHYLLLYGAALEDVGSLTDAEQTYKTLSSDNRASPEDHVGGVLGYARLRMMTDPAEAITILGAVRPPVALEWEVSLYRARAQALAGDAAGAQASLQQAWSLVPGARAEDSAPARTASDMLVAAGLNGDRNRLIALLTVDRLNRIPNGGQEVLTAALPICGASGIRAEDHVAVEFLRQAPPGRPRFSLMWASRPGIAAAFMSSIARNPVFQVADGQSTAVVLSCRTAPASDYQVTADLDDQVLRWSTGRGAYPLLATGDESDTVLLASMLADRERRYGATSIMLLPVLIRVLQPMTVGGSGNQESKTRAAMLAHRIANIIAVNIGPADIVLFSKLAATGWDVVAQNKTMATAQSEFENLLNAAASDPSISLDTLFTMIGRLAASSEAPTTLRARLLEQTMEIIRLRSSSKDPRYTALGLQLLFIRRDQGDGAEVSALTKRLGIPVDLCAVSATPVRFNSSNISADDYPTDLVQTLMQGRTTLEFSLNKDGNATEPRILISDPPYAFDQIALAKSATLKYEPAKTNGSARVCKAQIQSVRWQLPD